MIYHPSITEATATWSALLKKMNGIEYENILAQVQFKIRDKMSVNVLNPFEAESIGIDASKPVAYVHLRPKVGYAVFTIKNKALVQNTLDRLETPIPYRIEGDFIIFSSSLEVLEYTEFKGLAYTEEFQKITDMIKFDWSKNLLWMDSSYFQDKQIADDTTFTIPQGDRIAGIFEVKDNQLVIDMYTLYDDPQINKQLKNSRKVAPVQKLTLLDYGFGSPAIVGQMYVNVESFLQMISAIDSSDYLDVERLEKDMVSLGINMKTQFYPYLKGRLSYSLREYNPEKNTINVLASIEMSNKVKVVDNLKEIVRESVEKGMKIEYRDYFTQQFYGWVLGDVTLWIGTVEDHLIVATDEATLFQLIQNIYNAKDGFLRKLPPSFSRLINNGVVGGQFYLQNPSFIQNIKLLDNFFPFSFWVSVKSVAWDFYLIDKGNYVGRRDIVNIEFVK